MKRLMGRLVEMAAKAVAGAALASVVGVVAVGLVHSFDQEIKETKLVNSIEQTLEANLDKAITISESKYYVDMQFNRLHVADEVKASNAEAVISIDNTKDNGEEFVNTVHIIEFDGQYGLLITQDVDGNNDPIIIKYTDDIHKLARMTAFYGYGVHI
jgi:hypothetical protein